MAFRKSPIGVYRSPLSNLSSFGEIEPVNTPIPDGGSIVSFSLVKPFVLSKRALDPNLFSSSNVIKSGEIIRGNVSMAPTDPDNVERSVERSIRSYISNNPVNSD